MEPIFPSNRQNMRKPQADHLPVITVAQKTTQAATPFFLEYSAHSPPSVSRNGVIISEGNKYVGSTKDGSAHGRGTFHSTNPHAVLKNYQGEWFEGKKSGFGIATYQDGTYTGQFLDEKSHGVGKWVGKNGTLQEGSFKEGFLENGTEIIGNAVTKIVDGKRVKNPGCCTIL